jgi:hypothetical protein
LRKNLAVFLLSWCGWKWFLLLLCMLCILLNVDILFKILELFIFFIQLIFFENFSLLQIMWLWSKNLSLHITFKIATKLVWIRCCGYTSRMKLLLFKILFFLHFFLVFTCYFIHVQWNTPFFVFLLKYCFQGFYRVCFFDVHRFNFFLFFIFFYLRILIWLNILFFVFLIRLLTNIF